MNDEQGTPNVEICTPSQLRYSLFRILLFFGFIQESPISSPKLHHFGHSIFKSSNPQIFKSSSHQ